MVFLHSVRRTIAVFGALVLIALYYQTRLLQSYYLDIVTTVPSDNDIAKAFQPDPFLSVSSDVPKNSRPVRRWAYAFLVGGCAESQPEYRGFLYNVVVAAQRFKEFDSKAEVVLMVRMSVHTNETTLPDNEKQLLDTMGIRLHYIPKVAAPVHEVFYSLVQEKFRILDLKEYSRVLFLDGDITPLCNLDYLFELSEPETGEALLKENVVLSWRKEAANAGFFMLKPDQDDFRLIHDVIRVKEQKALQLPYPHWDEVEGWGHKIVAPDFWRTYDRTIGTNWTWHAAFADQGLLYYWTKYIKQSVSLIINLDIENWGSRDGSAYMETKLIKGKRGILTNYSCVHTRGRVPSPYRDFWHFTGRSKPWERSKHDFLTESRRNASASQGGIGDIIPDWFLSLESAEKSTNFSFDFSFSMGASEPPVGRFSSYGQMYQHIRARAKRNWTHYQ